MTRIGNRIATSTLAWLSLAWIAAVSSACAGGRITVTSSDARDLARESTMQLAVMPGPLHASKSDASVDEALLLAQAEDALRARGYAIVGHAGDGLLLEIVHWTESESVRTLTGDTDANAMHPVRRMAAVLTLRALDGRDGREIWRCEARGLLPKPGRSFESGAKAVWTRVLSRALAHVPARS